uniref:Chitin-binding type-2 domain-containing protein n=1 Tax=Anopheles dirus TaxID=7168 RepID=A0A182N0N3_9DIPT
MLADWAAHTLALVYLVASGAWVCRAEGPDPDGAAPSSPAPGTLDDWRCQRAGRFANPKDPSCRTYVTCIPAGDAFILRHDECGATALFSGRYQRCITGSDCAALDDFYAIEYACDECGKFALAGSTDCRQFVNCLKTKDPGVFVPIRQSCPVGRLFSAAAHACVPEEELECSPTPPPPPTTTTEVAPVPSATFAGGHLPDFVCLGPGRFPDESVPHCRGYRWCTDDGTDGRLVSRSFLCEPGRVFSETEHGCVPAGSYPCPDDDVGPDRFRCVAVGRFPDRSAAGCERYFDCQRTASGTLRATLGQCPPGTVFSWLTTRCVPGAEYVCPVAALGETVAVVLPAVSSRERAPRTRCSSSGRFANEADVHCRTYSICTRDARGRWVRVLVRCPAGTVFSRDASRCVGSETLPPPACTTPGTSTVASTSKVPIAPDDDPDSGYAESGEELECSEPDRLLPNPTDRTCRTYFGCRWDEATGRGRRLRLQLLVCSAGTRFSTSEARCVPTLEPAPVDDPSDDGSSEDRTVLCSEPELGSGEPPLEAWSPTSTTVATAISRPTDPTPPEQSTTTQPTVPERIAPQDGIGDDAGGGGIGSISYSGPAPEYPCTATGRFADINSVDCRSYFLCKLPHPSGSLVSVHLTCPDGMVFSRNVNKCVVSNRHVC